MYNPEGLLNLTNAIKLKQLNDLLIKSFNLSIDNNRSTFLDIGCGEGSALNCFHERLYDVIGIDYTDSGCKKHNPLISEKIIVGGIYDILNAMHVQNKLFDIINLDNILEHVIDPLNLLNKCEQLAHEKTIVAIRVPNDFSIVQAYLYDKKYVDREYWVCYPDHINYFNKDSLIKLLAITGWKCVHVEATFPIDVNLFNIETNYVLNKEKGGFCHMAAVELENLMFEISKEHLREIYMHLAQMGFGRAINSYFIQS